MDVPTAAAAAAARLFGVALTLLSLTGAAAAAAPPPDGDDYAARVRAAAPPCPPEAARCFGLRLFVADDADGAPVRDAAWIAAQIAHADLCFAPLGVGFELVAVERIGADPSHIATRAQRDALGRARFDAAVIDAWLVARLDNVDDPGEIRGVHWRDRARRTRRWLILSAIAPVHVLAHELGHYFGLPHSDYPASLMNTTGDDPTPRADRRFDPAEVRRAQGFATRYARAGAPRDRRAAR